MVNTSADHIWHDPESKSDGSTGSNEAFFRLKFNLEFPTEVGTPIAGVGIARISVDDDYELYINGELVLENKDNGFADVVNKIDFTPYLRNGENILAIHAVDGGWDEPRDRLYERVLFDAYIYSITHVPADFNNDLCVDRDDLNLVLNTIRKPIPANNQVKLDLNGDGVVNIADARKLVTLFTNERGRSCW